jgi:hypothetical protein
MFQFSSATHKDCSHIMPQTDESVYGVFNDAAYSLAV